MAQENMDLELGLLPSSITTDSNILRRTSSAPLINEISDNLQVFEPDTVRMRRNSRVLMSEQCLQCFSPSLQACVSCTALPPSPIPSPSRQLTKRSQNSTNIIRPSILGPLKRKGEMALEYQPKRFFQGTTNMLSSNTSGVSEKNQHAGSSGNSPAEISTVMNFPVSPSAIGSPFITFSGPIVNNEGTLKELNTVTVMFLDEIRDH
ncbi:protein FAM122A [Otolemur garnettii]|uniref:protein FAM122A n=1 Tax=Otolemur garnettii TaxID=30611 RepID=UPI0006445F67|nr:protein FAM122A [Otolemur garnettii]